MANDVFPPDYSTALGKVRALIPDVERVDWENDGSSNYMFTDNHLEGLLGLYPEIENPDNVDYQSTIHIRRAAADAVDVIATSEVLVSKVIKTEDLQTDGAKAANALILRAQQLRRQADKEEDALDLGTAFTVVDFQAARQPLGVWPPTVRTSPFDQVWGGA
jgi:hypothetical protein